SLNSCLDSEAKTMAMESRKPILLVLTLLGALSVLCLLSGGWLRCLTFLSHVVTIGIGEACRRGGAWTRTAASVLALVLVSEAVLYARMHCRRPTWMLLAMGITTVVTATMAILTLTCLGPSTTWRDTESQLPCWGHICPGQTTYDEVVTILNARPDIDSQSIRFYDYGAFRTITWNFSSKHQGTGTAYFVEDHVSVVQLYPCGITLGEVVEALGEPELFVARSGSADTRWRSVLLLYPEQGVLVSGYDEGHWNPQNGNERLEEGMPVNRIAYFRAGAVNDLLAFSSVLSTDMQGFQPWKGFGIVPYLVD
ncbi:MAG: hypothetical protein ACPL7K_07200, partial [Armatimonadota bacterium]